MRRRMREKLRLKIETAIYLAWLDEMLQTGQDPVVSHLRATKATVQRMHLLDNAWLELDWLPGEPLPVAAAPYRSPEDPLLTRLRKQYLDIAGH